MIINSLINVINSTNQNTEKIFNNIKNLETELQKINLDNNDKIKFDFIISNLYFLLQNQDLHQQELTSVIHNIGEKDNLDLSSYNLASKPNNIYQTSKTLTEDEINSLLNDNLLFSNN